jgi:hypothetical protein
MIIIYDHHTLSSYMIIIYDHHNDTLGCFSWIFYLILISVQCINKNVLVRSQRRHERMDDVRDTWNERLISLRTTCYGELFVDTFFSDSKLSYNISGQMRATPRTTG